MTGYAKEIKYCLKNITLHAKSWNDTCETCIIALHGWLDNANSFEYLAKNLEEYNVIAIDLAGHGKSDHRTTPYYIWEYSVDIAELITTLNKPIILMGHSMGASVSFITAALVSQQISSLLLLEGCIPIPLESSQFANQLINSWNPKEQQNRLHPNFKMLVKTRQFSPIAPLDYNRAKLLMQRSTIELANGKYKLLSDPKLKNHSLVKMNKEQIVSIIEKIICPTYLLRAENGLFNNLPTSLLQQFKDLKQDTLAGDHHFHMGQNSDKVAFKIKEFLKTKR